MRYVVDHRVQISQSFLAPGLKKRLSDSNIGEMDE